MNADDLRPFTITLEEAYARLHTWYSRPSEETTERMIKASLMFHAHGSAANRRAWHAACDAYTSEQREMAYTAASFGCDIDAATARQDLREAEFILDVDKLGASFDKAMMLARGCRIMAPVKRLDGRLTGFAAREADEPEGGR